MRTFNFPVPVLAELETVEVRGNEHRSHANEARESTTTADLKRGAALAGDSRGGEKLLGWNGGQERRSLKCFHLPPVPPIFCC
jgi:hypothetical protein